LTEDQRDYLAQAQGRLGAARLLLSQGFAEDAVSRAYYAMFYAAEALLEGEGLEFSSHAAVVAAFGLHFAKTGRVPVEYHRALIKAEALRRRGDYGPFDDLSAADAEGQVSQAERFFDLAVSLIQG
jgi:uncharacterized protein (UPF0332 family)